MFCVHGKFPHFLLHYFRTIILLPQLWIQFGSFNESFVDDVMASDNVWPAVYWYGFDVGTQFLKILIKKTKCAQKQPNQFPCWLLRYFFTINVVGQKNFLLSSHNSPPYLLFVIKTFKSSFTFTNEKAKEKIKRKILSCLVMYV